MSYIKDNYQTTSQFFKDVKNGVNDIELRLDDLESRREDIIGGGLMQEEEDGKEYKAGEGILITDDDSIALNYNGPFAYHLDHIDTTTATTLWITRSVGYVVRNGLRKTVYANTTPAAMASGESAWMLYNTDADSYSISIQTNAPTATSNKICVKLAENVNGVLRQIQFGEVVITETSGSTAVIGFPDYSKILTAELISLVNQQTTKSYNQPVWLVGVAAKNTGSDMSCTATITFTATNTTLDLFEMTIGTTTLSGISVPLFIPIPANTEFTLSASGGFLSIINVHVLPCI